MLQDDTFQGHCSAMFYLPAIKSNRKRRVLASIVRGVCIRNLCLEVPGRLTDPEPNLPTA
jgi:hypothetical protein